MAQPVVADDTPIGVARRHIVELLEAFGSPLDLVDVQRLSTARPQWPVWPQAALDRLIGPRHRRLEHLDLRWLHRFDALVRVVDALSAAIGGPVGGPSATGLLVERAELLGHWGWGSTSAGTSCRILRAADGWIAVNLPRDDDLAAVPALIDANPSDDVWAALAAGLRGRALGAIVERAALLGIPVAPVPTAWTVDDQRLRRGEGSGPRPVSVRSTTGTFDAPRPTVVDLTSLWAGPLAGWYLARAGARVIKVESSSRPDGARAGAPVFWRRLNADKELVEIDLATETGVLALRRLVEDADIVLEASRPRAMDAFGIDPAAHVAGGGIWCSITGYGRSGPMANRVAFGDDAAVAGGLVTVVEDTPWFIGDAAADPVSGVTAAAGVLALWATGRTGMVDVAIRDAVAHLTGGAPVRSRIGPERRRGEL